MNSIIDNKKDNDLWQQEEMRKCIDSQQYFYENYVLFKHQGIKMQKPSLHMFNGVPIDSKIRFIKGRRRNYIAIEK